MKRSAAIMICLVSIVVLLAGCASPELNTKVVAIEPAGKNAVIFTVQVDRTPRTADDGYYEIGVSVAGTVYSESTATFTRSDPDTKKVIVLVEDARVGEISADVNRMLAEMREAAQREYDQFVFEHYTELMAGALGFGPEAGMSYEEFRRLQEEMARLQAAVGASPTIDYDAFSRERNIRVVIVKKEPPKVTVITRSPTTSE